MSYGIGIVYGLGMNEDGMPEVHGHNKLLKLSELLNSGKIERGILAGGKREVELATDYVVNKMEIPKNRVYGDVGLSFVGHMYNIRETVGRWIRNGEISYDVLLYHIVQTWAVDRAKFDAEWVIPRYRSEIVGVEDGRPPEVVWKVDTSEEPRRIKIDKIASEVPILATYRPDLAQLVATFTDPFLIKNYGYRLLRI